MKFVRILLKFEINEFQNAFESSRRSELFKVFGFMLALAYNSRGVRYGLIGGRRERARGEYRV